MDRVIALLVSQYPLVPKETLRELLTNLRSSRRVASLLCHDTTDLKRENGGIPLEPRDGPLPPAVELRLFGVGVSIHPLDHPVERLLRDSTAFLSVLNRPRAFAWLASYGHTCHTYYDLLNSFVAAGARVGRSESYCRDCLQALRFLFPRSPMATTEGCFHRMRWNLYDTIAYLRRHPPRQDPHVHPLKGTLEVKHPYASWLLQRVLILDQGSQLALDESVALAAATEEAESSGCVFECQCCYETVPFERLASCPNAHFFCVPCLLRTVETLIGEGRSLVRCLSTEGCDCTVSITELERVLPERTVTRLTQTETLNAVLGSHLDHLVRCSRCGIPTIYEGCQGETAFKCPACHAETCLECGKIAHPGLTCQELDIGDPTALIQAKMNEALVRICPNCNTQILKEVGCNRMECPRCQTWFCYFCKKVIPKDVGYAHFWKGKGKPPAGACPLFMNNRKFNQQEVIVRRIEMETLFEAKQMAGAPPTAREEAEADEE